ncbi:MAG: nitrous oxide reductase accessory protein NosL [Aureibaculum sp.]|nr:nitrous oxide reductase accessory protein NosL [Aureibaculum sp.]
MKKLVGFLLVLNLLFSCSIEPSKIEYGKDACHYCKMTIVEETHAAEIVTKKGKPYKYDAIECLLNDFENREEKDIALFLVTDYLTPKKLIDAKTATYLISKNIKSPMGANLTAFIQKENAEKYATNGTNKIFNWEELQNHFFN